MSKSFIESKFNNREILIASRQQRQLSYFTKSNIQEDTTNEYLEQWANRNYRSNDYFLNFLKSVFKTDNFLLTYKYLRNPIPSSRLANKIKTHLKRVFWAEDPYFKYEINGESIKTPDFLNSSDFDEVMFNALIFRHNDIIITDLKSTNEPFRTIIPIENVISIDSSDSIIIKIAYSTRINGEIGILYIDSLSYKFYSNDLDLILDIPHDLGRCPADYISQVAYTSDVVRESIFTYEREHMEEYVFLKTLQRMVESSSVIPTVTMLDVPIEGNKDAEVSDGEPMSLASIGGQKATKTSITGGNNIMQSGNVIKVPLQRDDAGKIDMDLVKNYLNFFYIPIEALDYINKRVQNIEYKIISNVIGDHSEGQVQGSKSNTEINKVVVVSKQDKLRELSRQLSRLRTRSDYNFLGLKFGKDNISNEAFYGSDFFLESQNKLYDLIKSAPNPIEQKSLLIKSARNRNRFNTDNFTRDFILYQLMPYSSADDFKLAVDKGRIGEETFQYQTRFNYWINLFEVKFGDMLTFWNTFGGTESEKVNLINKLILTIIKDNYEKSSVPTGL